jgi:thioredoxin-dependent peroxiredoxin
MLRNGRLAPEFSLRDHEGSLVTLAELLAKGPLILFFYPGDFTPVCTREACMLRDLHAELAEAGLQVVGISPDDPEKHARFREKYELPYSLLADEERKAIELYEVDGIFGVRRATFLIGRDGYIRDTVLANLRVSRHEAFARKAIALAQSSTATPL